MFRWAKEKKEKKNYAPKKRSGVFLFSFLKDVTGFYRDAEVTNI
jgi:hypothetical protein